MSKDKKRNPRPVIDNRQARYNFELLESFEAGLALEGWEVKGIRSGEVDMKDSYVLMKLFQLTREFSYLSFFSIPLFSFDSFSFIKFSLSFS